MASIPLEFVPPDDPKLASLKIWEGVSATAAFDVIETVTAIGVYPDYITRYTSTRATDALNHWFAISWVDADGAESGLSIPVKGGTQTLVGKIIDRVHERDASLDKRVVAQEAEGAIQTVYGNVDPYDATLVASYRQLNGLVYLVMARAYTVKSLTTETGLVESATLGLVSFRSAQGKKSTINVQSLLDMANRELGMSMSFVLQLEDIQQTPYITADFSRLVSGWLSIDA